MQRIIRPGIEPMKPVAASLAEGFGVSDYFAPGEHERVCATSRQLQELGVHHLRLGLAYSDWQQQPDWAEWLLQELSPHFDLLLAFCQLPPLAFAGKAQTVTAASEDLLTFAGSLSASHGQCFASFELGNPLDDARIWDWTSEQHWQQLCALTRRGRQLADTHDKTYLLAGLRPSRRDRLQRLCTDGIIENIDALGLHGYPESWDFDWRHWSTVIRQLRQLLHEHRETAELWISAAGYSTWDHDEVRQAWRLAEAMQAPVNRVYWAGFRDMAQPEKKCIRADARCYHLGLQDQGKRDKFALRIWKQRGPEGLIALTDKFFGAEPCSAQSLLNASGMRSRMPHEEFGLSVRAPARNQDSILITGGAGFIGSNLARRLASQGKRVTILDNLHRPGVERNLESLMDDFGDGVQVTLADVRNLSEVRKAVRSAQQVYHFAAQVAVTTSLEEPREDFAINLNGTLNVLESLRELDSPPPLVFTSTNKVYGALDDLPLRQSDSGYEPDADFFVRGISEQQALDFHSPYGCSKGAADQYVLDYARSYGLPATVFRMSCVYGPQQFGTEDQGWVAHFLIQCLQGKPITIYGDGHQIRDLLYVDDLLDALELAQQQIARLSGRAFNIGGGAANSSSLLNVIKRIEKITGRPCHYDFAEWRQGDQRYYVSNTQLFEQLTGWQATTNIESGLDQLYRWLTKNANAAHWVQPSVEGGNRQGGTIN